MAQEAPRLQGQFQDGEGTEAEDLFNPTDLDCRQWVRTAKAAGFKGIIITAKTTSGQSNIGIGYETDAVAACVLGGTSFAGGISTAPGVVIGAIMIGCIYTGMNFLRIGSYYQQLAKGLIIIGAIMLDMAVSKKNR